MSDLLCNLILLVIGLGVIWIGGGAFLFSRLSLNGKTIYGLGVLFVFIVSCMAAIIAFAAIAGMGIK